MPNNHLLIPMRFNLTACDVAKMRKKNTHSHINCGARCKTFLIEAHIINLENETARSGAARKQDAHQVASIHSIEF